MRSSNRSGVCSFEGHMILWIETDASSDELLELETELKQVSSQ